MLTTLCHCWRLTRRDQVRFGFTDHDRMLAIGGETFEPHTGLSASEARQSLGLATDAMDLAGALSSERIDEADILAGVYDGAAVETFLVDWRAPSLDRLVSRALIGRITRRDGAFVAEMESPLALLDAASGRWFRRLCDATLGDPRCRFDIDRPGYTAIATITSTEPPNLIRVEGLAGFASGWFTHGIAHLADGTAVTIEAHRAEGLTAELMLDRPIPRSLAVGGSLRIAAGCDRQFVSCRDKFKNSANFRGFPHLPGNDAIYAYATEGVTFNGGPLVP